MRSSMCLPLVFLILSHQAVDALTLKGNLHSFKPDSEALIQMQDKLESGTGSLHKALCKLAQKEEGLEEAKEEPYFLKWPRSWVKEASKLNKTKTRNFNFIGKLRSGSGTVWMNEAKVRHWVSDFAKKQFGENDFFYSTTSFFGPLARPGYVQMGSWDHSTTPQEPHKVLENGFDIDFMQMLAESKFTLCPIGDKPWTARMAEAILTDSICIVKSAKDVGFMELRADTEKINNPPWRFYVMEDILKDPSSLVYREDWVADNMANFLKYHTYIQGDNYPEGARKHYPPAVEMQAASVFERLDQDGDGKVDQAELLQAKKEDEQPKSIIRSLRMALEKSDTGLIAPSDLIAMSDVWHHPPHSKAKRLKQAQSTQ